MASINKISVNGTEYDILADELASIVSVSDTQPTEESNKIWIKDDAEEIAVPTMDEFNAVKSDLSTAIISKGQIAATQYSSLAEVVEPGVYYNDADTAVFDDIPAVGSNGLVIVAQRSANWNLQIYLPTLWRTGYTNKTAYYRVINNKNYSILCDWKPFIDMDSLIEGDCLKKNQTCDRSDLTEGVISSGNIDPSRTDRICTQTYYKVSKGDVMIMVSDAVFMAITEYDTSKTFLRSSAKYYSKVYKNATTNYRPFVAPQDGYVRMHFISSASTAPTFDAVIGSFKIISQTDLYNYIALDEYTGHCPIQSRKPIKLDSSLICAQDGTFINGKLWSFDDGHNVVGDIKVVDVEAGTYTTRTHNLGHANSVDYNPNNDYLMMYGANGKNQPTIVLYHDPESKTDLRKTDSNCTIIGLYNNSSFLNCSASVCWGESDCIAYYMTGVYVDGDQTIAPTREIYKLLLGMGTNNLSANGGFGTYVSGKADNEYNGTAKILKTYTGEIPYLYINYGSGTGNLDTPQGMTYDKYVYVGWGFLGHNVLKIALNDDSNTYKVVDNYFVNVLNNQGVASFYEPEMVAIDGEYMYTGSRLSGNELFLKIRA